MPSMQSEEIRRRFLAFFEKRGHAVIPSAPLVPLNDPSVLFNTAGMQPLVPYLLGQKHPKGTRLVDVQKCVRTGDLDDIGDNRHFSFFEMLGNWSLGDYFKEDAIKWSYEFLTSKEEGLGLNINRLYFTIFEGDENAPYDQESKNIWMSLGVSENRIYALPAEDNWWSPGDNGPCGPCSEMFYDMTGAVGNLSKEEFLKAIKDESVIEIWNDVFMEYEKKDGKVLGKLAQKNVDTGAGLERITAVMQGKTTAYDTDIFESIMEVIVKSKPGGIAPAESWSHAKDIRSTRIIADHLRTAVFMIADGVFPSNTERGYVLRRLIRRSVVHINDLNLQIRPYWLVKTICEHYKYAYPNLIEQQKNIENIINEEDLKFAKTLANGLKEFEKLANRYFWSKNGELPGKMNLILGEDAFDLFQTYGFPVELTVELANKKGMKVDTHTFDLKMAEHQKLSQTASAGMFKGGLANHNEKTIRLHTAHHLLLSALQEVLSKNVKQRGSNITEERLRIDFAFDRKMTDEEKKRVEEIVNDRIAKGLAVIRREMPRTEAEKLGAEMEFGVKYPDTVSVYFIEDKNGVAVSKEFCGGPHVSNTNELGHFKIQKEEASSQGVRRIKAVLE